MKCTQCGENLALNFRGVWVDKRGMTIGGDEHRHDPAVTVVYTVMHDDPADPSYNDVGEPVGSLELAKNVAQKHRVGRYGYTQFDKPLKWMPCSIFANPTWQANVWGHGKASYYIEARLEDANG